MTERVDKTEMEKLRFYYIKPDDYEPIYVNGVYGGMTPRGDLLCHFFYEYRDIPAEEVVPLEKGRLQTEKISYVQRIEEEPGTGNMRRDVRVGLIIPAHQAISFANWILDKVKKSGIIIEEEEKKE